MKLNLWLIANQLVNYDIEIKISGDTGRTLSGPLPVESTGAVYVRNEGTDIVCHCEQGEIVIHDMEEKEGLLNDIEKVDDLKEFRKKHDKIFAKNPSPKDLLTEFPLINEYYKGLQVTLKTITTLRNSDFVKSGGITADQLADLKEKQRYASSMTTYIITAFAYVKKYSAYSAGLGEKPADITQTFEEIYDKKVVN